MTSATTSPLAISVVIATFNRLATLLRTLQTLFAQNYPPSAYEIVVVDDGSTDGTAEALRGLHPECEFRVIRLAHGERAAAQNAGLQAAKGGIVLFLDDDMLCEPSLLAEHMAARGNEDVVVFGPMPFAEDNPCSLAAEAAGRVFARTLERFARDPQPRMDDLMICANTSAPRSRLLAAGGFDVNCLLAQDAELGLRLAEAGIPFRYAPKAIARQLYVKTRRQVIENDATRYGRAEVYIGRKHPRYRAHSQLTPIGGGGFAKRLLRALAIGVAGDWQKALSAPIAMAEAWGARDLGLRLHRLQYRATFLRAAARECGGWAGLRREFGQRLPMLVYHHVGPRPASLPSDLTITPEAFRRHIQVLRRAGYQGISLAEWTGWVRHGTRLPRRPVVITFDDAYAGIATHALPILQAAGYRATFFVVTSCIGGINAWDNAHRAAGPPLMDAAELRYWAEQGFEVGSHSRTHADLTGLPENELLAEIEQSQAELQSLVARPVQSFAYPYGAHDARVRSAVARTYNAAVTVDEGINTLGTDSFAGRRTAAQACDSALDVLLRAAFGKSGFARYSHVWARLRQSSAA